MLWKNTLKNSTTEKHVAGKEYNDKDKNKEEHAANRLNMGLANWYENGAHYIGYHSDDEKKWFRTAKGTA